MTQSPPITRLAALAGVSLLLAWSYATTVLEMAGRWARDTDYSHGWLVPVFAGWLLWHRRARFAVSRVWPCWSGVGVLAAGVAVRLAGVHFYLTWFDDLSLVPCVAGLVLLVGGVEAVRWAWPAVAFLVFMPPLPYRVQTALAGPLQHLATQASLFLLQAAGFPAVAEGNVIVLEHVRVGVVEACNGLSMLLSFLALATAVATVIRRPAVDRWIVVASAVPVALAANVVRITVTGVLYLAANDALARLVFHDLAGWLMMPLALGLLWVELNLLSRLFADPPAGTGPAGAETGRPGLIPAAVGRATGGPAGPLRQHPAFLLAGSGGPSADGRPGRPG